MSIVCDVVPVGGGGGGGGAIRFERDSTIDCTVGRDLCLVDLFSSVLVGGVPANAVVDAEPNKAVKGDFGNIDGKLIT